jgi:glycosyltransferase involved in cell wall biosynthesis
MEVLRYRDAAEWDRFDFKLYNVGNNPWYHCYIYEAALRHPGTVILHDAVLYYLYTGYHQTRELFFQEVFEQEGPLGVALFKEMSKTGLDFLQFRQPELLPLNRELIDSGNAFLVHSSYTLNKIKKRAKGPIRSRQVNMVVRPPDVPTERAGIRNRFGIPPRATLVASFGFIAPTKLNHVVCEAIQRVDALHPGRIFYLMVGEGDYVDQYLGASIRKTGFVTEEEFDQYLACADLVVNLRYPSMGETSAALLRALSFARPCVVCNDGWFSELRGDVAVKLDPVPEESLREMLYEVMLAYLEHPKLFEVLGRRAQEWVKAECCVTKISAQIAQFLRESA